MIKYNPASEQFVQDHLEKLLSMPEMFVGDDNPDKLWILVCQLLLLMDDHCSVDFVNWTRTSFLKGNVAVFPEIKVFAGQIKQWLEEREIDHGILPASNDILLSPDQHV